MSQSTPRRPTRFASAIHPDAHRPALVVALARRRRRRRRLARSLARSLALKNPARNRSDRIITESARRTSFVRSSARRRRRSRSRPREGLTTDARARIPWASVATSCADGRASTSTSARGRHRMDLGVGAFGHSELTRFIHHSQKKNSWNTNACGRFDVL